MNKKHYALRDGRPFQYSAEALRACIGEIVPPSMCALVNELGARSIDDIQDFNLSLADDLSYILVEVRVLGEVGYRVVRLPDMALS